MYNLHTVCKSAHVNGALDKSHSKGHNVRNVDFVVKVFTPEICKFPDIKIMYVDI